MNEYREKILVRIKQASFSESDVFLWEKVLVNVPDELLFDIFNFIQISPENTKYLNENLKKKSEALEKKDLNSLDDIFADQKKFLQSLAPHFNIDL